MGIKLPRQKPKNFLLSALYRLQNFLPMSNAAKFRLFLNLEWIFDRLSHEISFKLYSPDVHPARQYSKQFLMDGIKDTDSVLDLGCNLGEISFMIADKAESVVGLDYNKSAIEFAKEKYRKSNLQFYNGEALSYLSQNKEFFDVLILSHILEHLDNPLDFLMSFKVFFKRIYIEVPDFDKNYLNHYRKKSNLDLIYSDEDHITEFDRDEIKFILEKCNIAIVKEEYRYGLQKIWCEVHH